MESFVFCIQQCFGGLPVAVQSFSKNNPVRVISVLDSYFDVGNELRSQRQKEVISHDSASLHFI